MDLTLPDLLLPSSLSLFLFPSEREEEESEASPSSSLPPLRPPLSRSSIFTQKNRGATMASSWLVGEEKTHPTNGLATVADTKGLRSPRCAPPRRPPQPPKRRSGREESKHASREPDAPPRRRSVTHTRRQGASLSLFQPSSRRLAGGEAFRKEYGEIEGRVATRAALTRDYAPPRWRQKILQQRKSLPIATVEKRLVDEVCDNHTLIIVGETGSGKTTQLPQFLFKAGFCREGKLVGVTQPRRVAAITVAKRVAEECGVQLGQRVGYSVRFDDMTSGSTRIKYMTDGLLLREALLDPYLSKYSVIVVDEAHERTVHTDVLLGLLKNVQKARSQTANESQNTGTTNSNGHTKFGQRPGAKLTPLRLIIMSASLDARVFSEYFGGARAVHVHGRQFSVDVFYTLYAQSDYVEAAIVTIYQIHLEEAPGDILVFLTGQEEIEAVEGLVKEKQLQLPKDKQNLMTVPMFASLSTEQQMKAFMPTPDGFRKVILATNIAETSVTIPGIKYVIDPGVVKARHYNPRTGIESLNIIPTSKAQALQRSGRAGREGPGKCFRLYTENEFEKLVDSTVPEIKRCNLANVILQLKAHGVDDITGFDFLEKPSRKAIENSLEELFLLGALKEDSKLSDPTGHQMARLPLDPIYSKALILASQFNCMEEMLITVSMLSVESIFYTSREKQEELATAIKRVASPEGDHITLINVYRSFDEYLEKSNMGGSKERNPKNIRKWCKENFVSARSLKHARDVHSQIRGHVQQMGLRIASCGEDMLLFRRCLAASFFMNAASRQPDGTYRALASCQVVRIHPTSVLYRAKPDCVIFDELVQTNKIYIRNVTRVDPLWLPELAPHYFAIQD